MFWMWWMLVRFSGLARVIRFEAYLSSNKSLPKYWYVNIRSAFWLALKYLGSQPTASYRESGRLFTGTSCLFSQRASRQATRKRLLSNLGDLDSKKKPWIELICVASFIYLIQSVHCVAHTYPTLLMCFLGLVAFAVHQALHVAACALTLIMSLLPYPQLHSTRNCVAYIDDVYYVVLIILTVLNISYIYIQY